MRILHTSDWHLGRTLYGRKRHDEFAAFLDWLADAIQRHGVEALLIAGDIFDTAAPGTRAQELYYTFLCRVAASSCRHVVIIAGNHDSPAFLEAPKGLLRALAVQVVGAVSARLEDEVLVLRDAAGDPELIVCAVPYLRDRDIRTVEAGESLADKDRKLLEGIRAHYAAVAALAVQTRLELGRPVPIAGLGHLFAAGGRLSDGVRDLYIGSLAQVAADSFPPCFSYLALGHLHVPQRVHGREDMRYSGSPLPLSFGEAGQRKSVCLVDIQAAAATVELLPVPVFQALENVRGDWDAIAGRLAALTGEGARCWLEISYEGADFLSDLRERVEHALSGSAVEVLRIRNNRVAEQALGQLQPGETLADLDANEVFARCLALHQVPETQQPELIRTYGEVLAELAAAAPEEGGGA